MLKVGDGQCDVERKLVLAMKCVDRPDGSMKATRGELSPSVPDHKVAVDSWMTPAWAK